MYLLIVFSPSSTFELDRRFSNRVLLSKKTLRCHIHALGSSACCDGVRRRRSRGSDAAL